MKNKIFSAVIFTLFIGIIACSGGDYGQSLVPSPDNKKPGIETFNQENLSFLEGDNSVLFTFKTNAPWVIDVADTRSSSWCNVTPSNGLAGSHTVRLSVTPNTGYSERRVTVTLKTDLDSKSFIVSQKQKDALILTSNKFEVPKAGGEVIVEVKANINYSATIDLDSRNWIWNSSTRGLASSYRIFTIDPSEESDTRVGHIFIESGDFKDTVKIYQAGEEAIILTERLFSLGSSGGNIEVELRSNFNYEVVMPNVDWITENKTRGMSSHTIYYTISPNHTYDNRSADIIFRGKNSLIADTVFVRQSQTVGVIFPQNQYEVPPEGGILDIGIQTNMNYRVETSDWITQIISRGLTKDTLRFSISENLSGSRREGVIGLTDGLSLQWVEVFQDKKHLPAEPIDLGLPSGLKWASYNVGAYKPEGYGDYYAWGVTEVQDTYSESTYKYFQDRYVDIGLVISGTDYDVAHVKWGGNWRMPTYNEMKELAEECTWVWTLKNGNKGYEVRSKTNSNSIFLPAAGTYYSSPPYVNQSGSYITGSQTRGIIGGAFALNFSYLNYGSPSITSRCYGHSIRPVCD